MIETWTALADYYKDRGWTEAADAAADPNSDMRRFGNLIRIAEYIDNPEKALSHLRY